MVQYILLKIFFVAKAYLCVQSLQCLKCENVIAPILCNGKATCDANEVCFIEKFKGFDEEILFNLGCRLNSKCSIQGGVDVCTNCCDSDLCNYGGCGETAPVNNHGHVCLSCKQSRNPAKCDSISVCENGEVCHIEEMNQYGIKFYTSGCLSEHLCRHFLTPTDIFGKRSADRTSGFGVVTCASCCHESLCNNKCPVAVSHSTTEKPQSSQSTSKIPSSNPTLSTVAQTELTTTSIPRKGPCQTGWVAHENRCYQFNMKHSLSWQQSREFCGNQGVRMVEIFGDTTTNFLLSHFPEWRAAGSRSFWIGATDNNTNTYRWSNGAVIKYQDWIHNPPRNTPNRQDCVYISLYDINGSWRPTPNCESKKAFICTKAFSKPVQIITTGRR